MSGFKQSSRTVGNKDVTRMEMIMRKMRKGKTWSKLSVLIWLNRSGASGLVNMSASVCRAPNLTCHITNTGQNKQKRASRHGMHSTRRQIAQREMDNVNLRLR